MGIRQKINCCISIEQVASSLYSTFMKKFPKERGFWKDLYEDEEDHVSFLKGVNYFGIITKVPTRVQPPPLTSIKEDLIFARDLKKQVKSQAISLEKALKMALKLEEIMAEIFTNDLIAEARSGNDKLFTLDLERILRSEKTHIKKIKTMIKKKGY